VASCAVFVPACRAHVFGHASACVPACLLFPDPLCVRSVPRLPVERGVSTPRPPRAAAGMRASQCAGAQTPRGVCRGFEAALSGLVRGEQRESGVGVIHEASRCEGAI
jgi:hypothetical protein